MRHCIQRYLQIISPRSAWEGYRYLTMAVDKWEACETAIPWSRSSTADQCEFDCSRIADDCKHACLPLTNVRWLPRSTRFGLITYTTCLESVDSQRIEGKTELQNTAGSWNYTGMWVDVGSVSRCVDAGKWRNMAECSGALSPGVLCDQLHTIYRDRCNSYTP